ncbi:MAG: DedA family protein [Actinomycetota bacterium]|nr:DedA family protein [Actinomycetota bacterium]
MAHFIDNLLTGVAGPVAYFLVFLVPALEASIFVGFVLPGETVVLLGGVLAAQHRASLIGMIAAAIAGAIIGDSVGYFVGRRFGEPLQQSRLGRIVGERRWRSAEDFLRRRGGPAVLLGRWTALLRALVPAAAGMAGLRYRTFLIWNVTGGVLWATAVVIAGYFAGNAYKRLEHYLGRGAFILLAVIVVGLVARHYWAKRRERRDGQAEPT